MLFVTIIVHPINEMFFSAVQHERKPISVKKEYQNFVSGPFNYNYPNYYNYSPKVFFKREQSTDYYPVGVAGSGVSPSNFDVNSPSYTPFTGKFLII